METEIKQIRKENKGNKKYSNSNNAELPLLLASRSLFLRVVFQLCMADMAAQPLLVLYSFVAGILFFVWREGHTCSLFLSVQGNALRREGGAGGKAEEGLERPYRIS